jgi:hypothetical protein
MTFMVFILIGVAILLASLVLTLALCRSAGLTEPKPVQTDAQQPIRKSA